MTQVLEALFDCLRCSCATARVLVKAYFLPLASLQLLEPLQRLGAIGKQIQFSGRVFNDGNGPPIDMIVYPVDGNRKGTHDLRGSQAASDVTGMRLTPLLKQPMLEANAPHGIG